MRGESIVSFIKIKPFVCDLISAFMIIVMVCGGLIVPGNVNVSIKLNVLTVSVIVIVTLYIIRILNNTIVIGLKGLLDFAFKKTVVIQGRYVSIIPLHHSGVSTVRINGKFFTQEYYKIIIESEKKMFSIISSEFKELKEDMTYEFEIGKFSGILLRDKRDDGDVH